METISVHNLQMTYRVPVKGEGLKASLHSLWKREYREVEALRGINLTAQPGEVIGFIGPNGAGKTTTLKILSGILHPTSGQVSVLGHEPWLREPAYLRKIALIRGSRPLSVPNELTVIDAIRFQQLIYSVPEEQFRSNLAELTDMLDLHKLLPRQARALSLGERMRAGLASSLIYRPKILFLDEPTLGLDVSVVQLLRRFIADYSRETGATVLLTSHYMADVEALCSRIVLINNGAIAYVGGLAGLMADKVQHKLIKVLLPVEWDEDFSRLGEVVAREGNRITLKVPRDDISRTTARLLAECPVNDLIVTDPPLEAIIDQVYREEASQ